MAYSKKLIIIAISVFLIYGCQHYQQKGDLCDWPDDSQADLISRNLRLQGFIQKDSICIKEDTVKKIDCSKLEVPFKIYWKSFIFPDSVAVLDCVVREFKSERDVLSYDSAMKCEFPSKQPILRYTNIPQKIYSFSVIDHSKKKYLEAIRDSLDLWMKSTGNWN